MMVRQMFDNLKRRIATRKVRVAKKPQMGTPPLIFATSVAPKHFNAKNISQTKADRLAKKAERRAKRRLERERRQSGRHPKTGAWRG